VAVYFLDLEFLCNEKSADKNAITAISLIDMEGKLERTVVLRSSKNFKVSAYCTELTGFTYEQLSNSPTLNEVYEDFFQGIEGKDHVIYAWGKDGEALHNVLKQKDIKSNLHIEDFQNIVKEYCELYQRPGLNMTMTMLQGKHKYKNHNVLDDTLMLREIYIAFNEDKESFKNSMRLTEFHKRVQDLYVSYKDVLVQGVCVNEQ